MEQNVKKIDQAAAVRAWLNEKALPLAAVTAGHDFADLQPLKEILAQVRVVGLGEATHGTREFFQCKHRLVEFLVKEMGFTVFVIEGSYAACQRINEYVLYGQNDPAVALSGVGFWTWDTEEVAALIEWMRQYNLTQPAEHKVRFCGNDVQFVQAALDNVQSFLDRVAPERTELTGAALAPVAETQHRARSTPTHNDPERKAASLAALEQLIGWLEMHRVRLSRQTSATEFELALQQARVLLQFQECYGAPLNYRTMNRDLYMAENTAYIANVLYPDAKLVVWAHNGHIHKQAEVYEGQTLTSQGQYMAAIFGPAYYAFGFAFDGGTFLSRIMEQDPSQANIEAYVAGDLTEFTVGPAPEGSLDWHLASLGKGDLIVDFRGAPRCEAVQAWLRTPLSAWSMGSVFSPNWAREQQSTTEPPLAYDGIIFVERTTAARQNAGGAERRAAVTHRHERAVKKQGE
jgi:erythromycin esterase